MVNHFGFDDLPDGLVVPGLARSRRFESSVPAASHCAGPAHARSRRKAGSNSSASSQSLDFVGYGTHEYRRLV